MLPRWQHRRTLDVGLTPLQAQISYDRFQVIAMANEAMELVRRGEMRDDAPALRSVLGSNDRKTLKQLMWGIGCYRGYAACCEVPAGSLCVAPYEVPLFK